MAARWQPRVARVDGPVPPVAVDPAGLAGPTRGQANGPGWRRSSRGLYVPSSVDPDRPEQRIVEQAARLGPAGAVTAWSALWLHGAAYFDGMGDHGPRPVVLHCPDRHLRGDASSRCLLGALPEGERLVRHGISVTTVERALFDEMGSVPLRDAVVAMDMAAAAAVTSVRRMTAYCHSRPGLAGAVLVLPALSLADEHSRSPAESRVRLSWVLDAKLPRPVCNRALFATSGRLLGVPDLLDVDLGVVGEYDGADHQAGDRRFRDLAREQLFRDHGLEYFTVVAGDLHHLDRLVARMHATFERARRTLSARERRWTLTPPPGWIPFESQTDLDERLDLRDFLAETRET